MFKQTIVYCRRFVFSFYRKSSNAYNALDEGSARAEKFILVEMTLLDIKCLTDIRLRAIHISTQSKEITSPLMFSIELQLLWGFFQQHVNTYETPVAAEDRISLHIIHWLINHYDLSIDKAKSHANGVAKLSSDNDSIFFGVKELGRMAYLGQTKAGCFYQVICAANYGE